MPYGLTSLKERLHFTITKICPSPFFLKKAKKKSNGSRCWSSGHRAGFKSYQPPQTPFFPVVISSYLAFQREKPAGLCLLKTTDVAHNVSTSSFKDPRRGIPAPFLFTLSACIMYKCTLLIQMAPHHWLCNKGLCENVAEWYQSISFGPEGLEEQERQDRHAPSCKYSFSWLDFFFFIPSPSPQICCLSRWKVSSSSRRQTKASRMWPPRYTTPSWWSSGPLLMWVEREIFLFVTVSQFLLSARSKEEKLWSCWGF